MEDSEDATILMENTARVLRGGTFGDRPGDLRSAYRDGNRPGHRDGVIGFRLARTYN